ncbi:MAG: PD40 domain-containing protein, partial [Chloroflexi bacterium]|nr:PD40 domain-containing protein [Chloroflexota bacterium]
LLVFGSVAQRAQQQMALAPTPLLPVPTLTSEPYPPPIRTRPTTETPEPYPPPTRTPAPTIPTPTLTTTLTPVPTPTAFVSGLKLLWAEATITEGVQRTPTFLLADVGDLANRSTIYTLPWSTQLVRATLSPDGSKIAYTTLSRPGGRPGLEGTLWVMNIDGSGQWELAGGMEPRGPANCYPAWSPDNRMLAYTKYAPKFAAPAGEKDEDLYRTEIHVVAADGSWERALIADDAESPHLIGWSPEGKVLYGRLTSQGYELWTVDMAGNRTFITLMHTEPVHLRPLLSPDHKKMIFTTYSPLGIYEGLVYLSADGREKRGMDINLEKPWNIGGWVSNDELILHIGLARYRIMDVHTMAYRDITVAARLPDGGSDYFLSMSPDGQWLVMENYPKGGASLLQANSQVRITITGNWFLFLGWLTYGR